MAFIVVCVFALSFGGKGRAAVRHTCSAVDRQFMTVAQLNMAALGSLSEDYLRGDAKPADVIDQTKLSITVIGNTNPTDPSLAKTRAILRAMFIEYGRAIHADAKHKNPGKYIYRAYGLANFAHDILSDAKPGLMERGCDVGPLL